MALCICNYYLKVFKGEELQTIQQELWFLCSARRLMIPNNCMKFQEDIFNGFHVKHRHDFVIELLLTKFKGEEQKMHIQELWLLCSARRLMVLNICMKFYEHISNGFKVTKRT